METREIRLKRLKMRAGHRGIKEMDLILGGWAARNLETADDATLDRIEGEGRVAFRYNEPVNGSSRAIAGLLNDAGNVLGMMPHPERMIEDTHGGSDGRRLFEGLIREIA